MNDHAETQPTRGSLLVIFLTVFVDLLGFGIVLPLLPIYGKQLAEHHGMSSMVVGVLVGALMASFSLMQFLFLPVWGGLSDRWGRRPILLVGLAGSTVCYALFGLATQWQSLTLLFVTRIGAGIAGATISTAQAYIADCTTKENRAKGMALIGAAFALSFTIGPLIGASAVMFGNEAYRSPWPGYLAAALSAGALILAILKLPESRHASSSSARRGLFDLSGLRTALVTPSIGMLLLASSISVLSFSNFESTLSLQIEQIAAAGAAAGAPSSSLTRLVEWVDRGDPDKTKLAVVMMTFAYLGMVMTLAQGFLVRRMASYLSEKVMAVGGCGLSLFGFVLLAQAARSNHFGLLCGAMAVEVVGFAFVTPSLQSLISRRTDPDHQGRVLGVSQSCSSLARIIGPMVGLVLFHIAPIWPFIAAAGLMALGLAWTLIAVRGGHDWQGKIGGRD